MEELEDEYERIFGERADVSEEAQRAKFRSVESVPLQREVDEHNIDHAVFRSWCPHCVKGKASSYGHPRNENDKGDIPKVCIDYMYMHSQQEKEEEKGMPILVMKDERSKMVTARVVKAKGKDPWAIGRLKYDIELLGYKKIVLRSDGEPAIVALKEAVRRETEVEIVMETTPVDDHQANGVVESAVRQVQGQFRAMKDALDSRYKTRVGGDHPAIPWLVTHAASVITRMRKDSEGFTAYRRWKGRAFNRPVTEFGECVLYLPAKTAGRDKFDVRWQEGIWLGVRLESGESVIGTNEGVVKARDFRRKSDENERWNVERFNQFVGVPWEPVPGRSGDIEIKSKVRLPTEPDELTKPVRGRDGWAPRRFHIQRGDVKRHGFTTNCPGCRAINRGERAVGHTEECRKRFEEQFKKDNDERMSRQRVRFNEYKEEQEANGEVKKKWIDKKANEEAVKSKGENRGREGTELANNPIGASASSGLMNDAAGRVC